MPTITWGDETADFTPGDATATPGVWFRVPDDIRSHERKLFAHYFQTFPISIDNGADPANDYWTRGYMKADGEGGKWRSIGGYLRNRPKERPQIPGDYVAADAATDIRQAIAAGLDGFFCDVMSTNSKGWTFYQSAYQVAGKQFPGFYVTPMVDVGGTIGGYTVDAVADAIFAFYGSAATWMLPDGRMVVSAYRPEAKPVSWWQDVFTSLKNRHGVTPAFLPAYLDISASPNFAKQPWTYGSGFWGDGADPQIQSRAGNKGTAVHARGEKYLFPVQGQSFRVKSSQFDEAYGTAALRTAWARAISDQADVVQLVTWNDYSEGGEFNDSMGRGLTELDIAAFYSVQWKTGTPPPILKDAVILSHRDQLAGTPVTGGQTQRMVQWARGNRGPVVDLVEVLTFLTAPADVTVTVGGKPTTFTAPAGVNAQYVPLLVGPAPSVVVVRAGTQVTAVTSPAAVLASPVKDDVQYFRVSSERGAKGQADPQVKYGN